MKLKSKLVLAASSLLVLSGVAAGTGTYAWFTANTAAYAGISDATVSSKMEDVKIAIPANQSSTLKGTDVAYHDGSVTLSFANNNSKTIPDVSCNGTGFYRCGPNKDNDTLISPAYEVFNPKLVKTEDGTTNELMFHQVELEFKTEKTDISTGIFLSRDTSFSIAASGTGDLYKGARVAVYSVKEQYYNPDGDKFQDSDTDPASLDKVDVPDALLALYAPSRTIADPESGSGLEQAKYIDGSVTPVTTAGNIASNYEAFSNGNSGAIKYLGVDNYKKNSTDADFETAAPSSYFGYLGQAGSGVGTDAAILKVIVRVWLEGTDSVVKTDNVAQVVASNIQFIGVNTNGKLS